MYAGSKDRLEAELSSVKRDMAKAESKSDELSIALDKSHQEVTALQNKAQKCVAVVNSLKVRVHFAVVCVVRVCMHTYVHAYIVSL